MTTKTTPQLSDEPNAFGSYEIRWSELRGGVWRSRRKSTRTGDRSEAEIRLARFLLDRQRLEPDTRHKVGEICEAYIVEYAKPRDMESNTRSLLKAPREAFGARDPLSLNQADIDDFVRRRMKGAFGKKVLPQTAAREVVALQAALNWGSQKRLMVFGRPRFTFSRPQDRHVRIEWLDEQQERDILSKLHLASWDAQAVFHMGVTYGARRGAMLDLRFIPEQVNWITNQIDFKVPGKRLTRKRRPHGPMKPDLRRVLEVLYQQRGPGALVLDRYADRDFKAFMDSIGYEWVTPHVLKHTAISLALRAGRKPEQVAGAFQTDLRTIMSVYRHFSSDELDDIFGARR